MAAVDVSTILSHFLPALVGVLVWAVSSYIFIYFVSPYIAATLVHLAFRSAKSKPGGDPIVSEKAEPFRPNSDEDEIKKRNIDMSFPLLKRIVQESISHSGGLAAVLLQIAHPGVGAGVGRHSNFSLRLRERTENTAIFVYVMVFGTDAEKHAIRKFVTTAHKYVNNSKTKNTYNALDPHLQLWVAATMYASMIQMYESVFPALTEKEHDQVYQEFSIFGTSLQVPLSLWPADRQAFWQYWDAEIAKLGPTVPVEAIKVSQDLFHPKYSKLPWTLAPILFFTRPVNISVATEQLPEAVCRAFGLRKTVWTKAMYNVWLVWNRLTYRMYPQWVRTWAKDYYLWLMRRRITTTGMVRNGKVVVIDA